MTRAAAATIVLLSAFAQSLSGQADLSTPVSKSGSGDPHQTWTLARGIGSTGNQIDFDQGTAGVWYFMVSSSAEHNPQLYRFIREFNAPALTPFSDLIVPAGFSCWQEPNDETIPSICFNANDHPVMLSNAGPIEIPPRTVAMHPWRTRFAVVAWRSPVNGVVRIRGSFSDLDPNCGNGILWSIDRGDETLLTDDIANGAAQDFDLAKVRVRINDVLYFIVDAKGDDYVCDSTALNLTISRGLGK